MTDVASKWASVYSCELPAHCRVMRVVPGSYYSVAMYGMPLTHNDLLATVYLQWFTCDANFLSQVKC